MSVVDQLLAAITRDGDHEELNAALDFRLMLAGAPNPAAVLRAFFDLRHAVAERHYLPFYRLRRWLETNMLALVHVDRSSSPHRVRLQLDAASFGALYAQCAVTATAGRPPQAWTRVQFAAADLRSSGAGSEQPLPTA
ncbi:hypothetical protein [Opitutus terrae]|uniref:hypothetical protein n=1 Tax=Opitutus terrae TaxID=107709 RepID=UPI0002E80F98|nr:hypothetical protein [Opitutus terrae]